MLRQLATYFADILSRDRCAVELTDNWWSADIRFELVPISDENPSAGIYFLHQQLVGDSVSGLPTNEAIRIISSYFRTVSATRNQEQYYYFLHRAEEAMIEDIGVFPLFRPTLFFVAHKHLQGVNFDKSGHLDCSYLARLLLPSVHAESER